MVQLALVVVSFLIGYLPHVAYYQTTKHEVNKGEELPEAKWETARRQKFDYWVGIMVSNTQSKKVSIRVKMKWSGLGV